MTGNLNNVFKTMTQSIDRTTTESAISRDTFRLAVQCQDACNLSGVLHDFDRIVQTEIWAEARRVGGGTQFVNTHPITVLFVYKLATLCGLLEGRDEIYTTVQKAWNECEKQTGQAQP